MFLLVVGVLSALRCANRCPPPPPPFPPSRLWVFFVALVHDVRAQNTPQPFYLLIIDSRHAFPALSWPWELPLH